MKLRKRMLALHKIKAHAMAIDSADIFIEQTIYQNFEQVVGTAAHGFRFEEQSIMFDFNPTTFGIHMQVEEDIDFREVRRFEMYSVPSWFEVGLRPPDMLTTPYCNNLMALFHFNQGDCEILPATHVIQYKRCSMDIDRNLYFVKVSCNSVEEARKRAIVMAYLTYDMTRHLFVKFSTGRMLEDPFTF